MNKRALFILLMAGLFCFTGLRAANGDTIRVKTHNDVEIATDPGVGFTAYKMWGQFPAAGVPVHKMLLKMNIRCPNGKNCGEWDYLNFIYARRKGGVADSSVDVELARYITPYGNSYNASFGAEYIMDLTDWEWLLRDSVEIEYRHTGYETNVGRGWVINLEFIFIEGTPIRPFVKYHHMWNGGFPYGAAGNSIENYLTSKSVTIAPNSPSQRLRIVQTGHGADNVEYCSEFCPKWRRLIVDNNTHSQVDVWRDDCGLNPVFPQAGTWIYDRAAWCPGATVNPDVVDFNFAGGSTHTLNFDMQPFTNTDGSQNPNYVVEAYLIEYGTPSFTTDASVEDVARPSTQYEYRRMNPICASPRVRIRNNGTSALTSATIRYGVEGGSLSTYNWSGNLAFMESEWVDLPANVSWSANSGTFITQIEAGGDQYAANNTFRSRFVSPPVYPSKFVVAYKSNLASGETQWFIYDQNNTIVESRTSAANNTTYNDTITLPAGCYRFEMVDSEKDGIRFWANNDGNGSIRFAKAEGPGTYISFNGDFGTSIIHSFMVGGALDVTEPTDTETGWELFPVPASDQVTLLGDPGQEKTSLRIMDAGGKLVRTEQHSGNPIQFSVAGLATGMYYVQVQNAGRTQVLKFIRE